MAYTLRLDTTKQFELREYVDFVKSNVDVLDVDSMAETAWALKALGNNRTLVSDVINDQMKRFKDIGDMKMYSPQSLILASTANFVVRANLWIRPSDDHRRAEFEIPLFSYLTAHDHNFHFATVGYHGSGYETEIYEYDHTKVEGFPGESVELTFLERTRLGRGDVMVYRAGKDVHRQMPPDEPSVSLNLLSIHPQLVQQQQYLFDVHEKKIARYFPDDDVHLRYSMLELAQMLHDDNTVDVVHALARQHPCEKTRASAYSALFKMRPLERAYFESHAANDARGDLLDFIERMNAARNAADERQHGQL